jgi:hypothetical protein
MSTGNAAIGQEWWTRAQAAVCGAFASVLSPAIEVRIWIAAPRLGTADLLREVLLAELVSCLASSMLGASGRLQRATAERTTGGCAQVDAGRTEGAALAIRTSCADPDGQIRECDQMPVAAAVTRTHQLAMVRHDAVVPREGG